MRRVIFMPQFEMPSQESKAEFVKTNFDIISSKYDLFNDLNSFYMHRLWKNSVIELIKKNFSHKDLDCMDLCCGTGDISVRLADMPEVKKLYAVDFSEKMISYARERLKSNPKAIVEIGDATNLSKYPTESLDVLTIGFGLRNVDKLELTLKEVNRVLKKGGLFINLDVGKVKNPLIRFFADFYFFKIVPIFGYLIWGKKNDMFDYLPVSSLYYPNQEELVVKIQNADFEKVNFKNFVFGNVALHWGFKK
jgi:demethylmenaquinone methyltransferase/2-methoxy-6-polyprenyl-1,4-benzoquinol methylase